MHGGRKRAPSLSLSGDNTAPATTRQLLTKLHHSSGKTHAPSVNHSHTNSPRLENISEHDLHDAAEPLDEAIPDTSVDEAVHDPYHHDHNDLTNLPRARKDAHHHSQPIKTKPVKLLNGEPEKPRGLSVCIDMDHEEMEDIEPAESEPFITKEILQSLYMDEDESTDKEILLEFYNSCNGRNWTVQNNWCSDKPLAEWFGVEIVQVNQEGKAIDKDDKATPENERINRVRRLTLPANGLTGHLNESLGGLTYLEELDLNHNNLFGIVPESFGKLARLKSLNLSCNQIEGCIPESIGTLQSLKRINLRCNKFEGRINNFFLYVGSKRQVDLNKSPFLPEDYASHNQFDYLIQCATLYPSDFVHWIQYSGLVKRNEKITKLKLPLNEHEIFVEASTLDEKNFSFDSMLDLNLDLQRVDMNLRYFYSSARPNVVPYVSTHTILSSLAFIRSVHQVFEVTRDLSLFEKEAVKVAVLNAWIHHGRPYHLCLCGLYFTYLGLFTYDNVSGRDSGEQIIVWLVLIFNTVLFLYELYQICRLRIRYFLSSECVLKLSGLCLIYAGYYYRLINEAYSDVTDGLLLNGNAQISTQLLAYAAVCLWINLLHYFKPFHFAGQLIRTIFYITDHLTVFFFVLSVAIFAFAQGLFLLATTYGDTDQLDGFSSLQISLLSTFAIVTSTASYPQPESHFSLQIILQVVLVVFIQIILLNFIIVYMNFFYRRIEDDFELLESEDRCSIMVSQIRPCNFGGNQYIHYLKRESDDMHDARDEAKRKGFYGIEKRMCSFEEKIQRIETKIDKLTRVEAAIGQKFANMESIIDKRLSSLHNDTLFGLHLVNNVIDTMPSSMQLSELTNQISKIKVVDQVQKLGTVTESTPLEYPNLTYGVACKGYKVPYFKDHSGKSEIMGHINHQDVVTVGRNIINGFRELFENEVSKGYVMMSIDKVDWIYIDTKSPSLEEEELQESFEKLDTVKSQDSKLWYHVDLIGKHIDVYSEESIKSTVLSHVTHNSIVSIGRDVSNGFTKLYDEEGILKGFIYISAGLWTPTDSVPLDPFMFYRADCDPGIRVPVYCTQSNKTNPVDYIVGGSIVCVSKSITDGFNEVFDDAVSKGFVNMNFENVKWVPLETTLKELREPMSYVETSKSLYMKLWYRADTQAFAVPVYAEPSDGSKIVETVEHDNIICVGRQVNKGFHELFENGEKKGYIFLRYPQVKWTPVPPLISTVQYRKLSISSEEAAEPEIEINPHNNSALNLQESNLWFRVECPGKKVAVHVAPSNSSEIVAYVRNNDIICVSLDQTSGFHKMFANGDMEVNGFVYMNATGKTVKWIQVDHHTDQEILDPHSQDVANNEAETGTMETAPEPEIELTQWYRVECPGQQIPVHSEPSDSSSTISYIRDREEVCVGVTTTNGFHELIVNGAKKAFVFITKTETVRWMSIDAKTHADLPEFLELEPNLDGSTVHEPQMEQAELEALPLPALEPEVETQSWYRVDCPGQRVPVHPEPSNNSPITAYIVDKQIVCVGSTITNGFRILIMGGVKKGFVYSKDSVNIHWVAIDPSTHEAVPEILEPEPHIETPNAQQQLLDPELSLDTAPVTEPEVDTQTWFRANCPGSKVPVHSEASNTSPVTSYIKDKEEICVGSMVVNGFRVLILDGAKKGFVYMKNTNRVEWLALDHNTHQESHPELVLEPEIKAPVATSLSEPHILPQITHSPDVSQSVTHVKPEEEEPKMIDEEPQMLEAPPNEPQFITLKPNKRVALYLTASTSSTVVKYIRNTEVITAASELDCGFREVFEGGVSKGFVFVNTPGINWAQVPSQ